MQKLDAVDAASLRDDIPSFRAGDTLKVHVKVIEGNRSRIQVFQGVVIARRGHGVSSTFTIRKVSFGVGVERTFPVHAPTIRRPGAGPSPYPGMVDATTRRLHDPDSRTGARTAAFAFSTGS